MTHDASRPDVNKILSGLKPFQRDTVEYVFDRLYRSENSSRRFLVADEVGLGKTLVARGLIAKAIDHLWDKIDRIDIVYICSNTDIARQNINRLNITGKRDFAYASRLTLLPVTLSSLNHKLNFVSFTPGTSFELKSSTGIQEERALLFHLLHQNWEIAGTGLYNLLQCDVSDMIRWRSMVNAYEPGRKVDKDLARAFFTDLDQLISEEKKQGQDDIRSRFFDLCNRFSHYRMHKNLPRQDVADRNALIGELRAVLAKTCLKALEPDIVILDEFQRFKHLLTDESDAGILAQELFNYSDADSKVRTLLLSATPYKMYTLYEESFEDDHYRDFIATLEFLENDPIRSQQLKALIEKYRREMYRFGNGDANALPELKSELENSLRRTMVRTERIASASAQDDMLKEVSNQGLAPSHQEIQSYIGLHHIAKEFGHGDMIEYWKSAPYLLNFMDHYKFKETFSAKLCGPEYHELSKLMKSHAGLLLPWKDIQAYEQLDPGNSRMRGLINQVLDCGAWMLLWVPPSCPYYRLKGPYAKFKNKNFTKRLIFSSWTVVPKVIAAMLSYEAERRMFKSYRNDTVNTPDERKKHRPLLKFSFSNERLTGLPVLGLIYPSFVLARLGDPLDFLPEDLPGEKSTKLTAAKLTSIVADRIKERLAFLPAGNQDSQREDEAWYWAAPILLDLAGNHEAASGWLTRWGLARLWCGGSFEIDEEGGESRWADHVSEAVKLLDSTNFSLGRQPEDLPVVLAKMAIGGPAVAALRALCRVAGGLHNSIDPTIRDEAGTVAWGFRKIFNNPEVMALVRGQIHQGPYWQRTLEYCVNGGIQPVLDEYAHILQEFLGVKDLPIYDAVREIASAMSSALSLMTSRVEVDDFTFENATGPPETVRRSVRNSFALRFGIQKSDVGNQTTREDQVRIAFNSPFWPFVLASTSVGQEGLDFHPYCHALVHWNLPSNPVDMEQREGRIHRYKGHAVRKNLVSEYVDRLNGNTHPDPWELMFEMARKEHWDKSRGLAPYWSFPIAGGAQIERHVPTMPFSRDIEKLNALKKSLVIYRMVFGQTRQEDMVEYLLSKISDEEVDTISQLLQIRLGPPEYEEYS